MRHRSSQIRARAGARPSLPPEESASLWREELVTTILRIGAAIGFLALFVAVPVFLGRGRVDIVAAYIVLYTVVVAFAIVRALPYALRAGMIMAVIYALAMITLTDNGLSSSGRLYLLVFTILGFLFFGTRAGLAALAAGILTLAGVGWLAVSGRLSIPPEVQVISQTPAQWVLALAVFMLLSLTLNSSIVLLQRNFINTLKREREAREELQRERQQLEERVAERTRTIERRTAQVLTGAEIARAASTELDPGRLLQQVVDLL